MPTSPRIPLLVAAFGVTSAIAAAPVGAQPRGPLRAESYRTADALVEVVGLRRWTLAMLRDSIRARNPGLDLHDAACMVVLRDELGFRDALVNHVEYTPRPDAAAERYVVIKLVEPGDSSRVQWARATADSFRVLRPGYAPLLLGATDSTGSLRMPAIEWPLQFGADSQWLAASVNRMPPALRATAIADAQRLRAFQTAHATDADRVTAMHVLERDGAYENRLAAVVILARFAAHDSTWHALAGRLRDRNEGVRTAAQRALRAFPARSVDWTPALPVLRALLAGTNVGATEDVLELLARTHTAPALAGPLLGGNGEWVLAHLSSEVPGSASSAHAFLVQLNGGVDLGREPSAWAAWLARLPVPRA